jgi:GWxTD domain-containing protein
MLMMKGSDRGLTDFKIYVILFIVSIVLMNFSCSTTSKISNRNLAYLYNPGSNFIHPDIQAVNITPDTTRLFFRFPSDELMYVKSDTASSFYASFSIGYSTRSSYESKDIIDSGVVYFESTQVLDSIFYISGQVDIKASTGFDYLLQVVITDHHRNQAVASLIDLDRTGRQSPNDFMVIDNDSKLPVYFDYLNRDSDIQIISSVHDADSVWMRFFDHAYPLPRPPFSATDLKTLNYRSSKAVKIKIGAESYFSISEKGIYHFQFDTTISEGLTIMRFSEDYPNTTSPVDLIEPLRYLTTHDEYRQLKNSRDKRKAVENYWLTLSGSRERGRVLIKSYYSRVQFANRHFSSYLEGWKTDRGLIYLIFGPPGTVYISDDSESWNYGQMNSYSSLIYTFDNVNNPFTKKDYHLRRGANYEVPWYRAVDSWRSGRVVNDTY